MNEAMNAASAVFALPVKETRGMTMVKGYSVEWLARASKEPALMGCPVLSATR